MQEVTKDARGISSDFVTVVECSISAEELNDSSEGDTAFAAEFFLWT